jgi:hypothetical protein
LLKSTPATQLVLSIAVFLVKTLHLLIPSKKLFACFATWIHSGDTWIQSLDKQRPTKTMSASLSSSCIRVAALWVGSNKPICSDFKLEVCHDSNANALRLQQSLARLLGLDPETLKAFLSVPNGPELTPVLPTLNNWESLALPEARLKATWTSLLENQPQGSTAVVRVYVTQHSPFDVAVSALIEVAATSNNILDSQCFVSEMYGGMSYELRSNPKVAIAAFNLAGLPPLRVPRHLQSNKQFLFKLLSCCSDWFCVLELADETLQDDKALVLASIEANSANFKHASPRLKEDNEVCFAAFLKFPLNIADAGPSLRGNKETMLHYISLWPESFEYVMPALKADEEVVLSAVSKNGALLSAALQEMQADVDVVQAAVANYPASIKYASENMQQRFKDHRVVGNQFQVPSIEKIVC